MKKREPNKILAEKVKMTRVKLMMTQEALAAALGYKTNSMISQIESGDSGMSTKKIAMLAALANVPASTYHDQTIKADEKLDLFLELGKLFKDHPNCHDHIQNISEYIKFVRTITPKE